MKKISLAAAIAGACALLCAVPALAQTTTTYKDAGGNTQSACVEQRTYGGTAMNVPCHVAPDVQGSGSVAAQTTGSALQVPIADGQASMGFTTHGLAATGATLTVQWSNDGGVTWTNLNEITAAGATAPGATITTDDNFRISVAGRKLVQFVVTTAGSSGSPTIAYDLSVGAGPIVEANSKAILNQMGADGTGITAPTGGSGVRGWLSGMYNAVKGILTVKVVDSGGGDATDTTNHAVRVNCVVGCSSAVTVAAGADVTEGTTADAAYAGSGNATVDALLKGLYAAATTTPLPAGSANTVIGATGGALRTAGGWTPILLNGLTTTLKQIKATAGQLGMLQCYNPNTAQVYVQLLDSASPTLGTTAPVMSVAIAPGATGGVALSLVGVQFNNAIQVAATTTATGSTAPSTALDCNALFN